MGTLNSSITQINYPKTLQTQSSRTHITYPIVRVGHNPIVTASKDSFVPVAKVAGLCVDDTNKNGSELLSSNIASSNDSRPYMGWNLTTYPSNAVVTEATLQLYPTGTVAVSTNHRLQGIVIGSENWAEDTITCSVAPAGSGRTLDFTAGTSNTLIEVPLLGSFQDYFENRISAATGSTCTLIAREVTATPVGRDFYDRESQISSITHTSDASHNGLNFTRTGTPTEAFCPMDKYGKGLNFANAQHHLRMGTGSLGTTGDFTIFIAFKVNSLSGGMNSLCGFENLGWALAISGNQSMAYEQDSTLDTIFTRSIVGEQVLLGSVNRMYLKQDTTNFTITGKLNGGSFWNSTYQADDSPDDAGSGLVIGSRIFTGNITPIAISGLEIYEFRVWHTLIDNTILDKMADPTDQSYKFTPEGTEVGCYFFESGTNTVVDYGPRVRLAFHTPS